MLRRLSLIVLLFVAVNSFSQETNKSYFKSSYWQFFNVEHYFQDSSYIYFEENLRFDPIINSFSEKGVFEDLYRIHHMFGYSHHSSPSWNMGADIKFVNFEDHSEWFFKTFIQHKSKLNKIIFSQELAFEYLLKPENDNPAIVTYDLGRLSAKFELSRDFEIAGKTFGLLTFYRLFFIKELGNEESVFSDRYIDKTRWKVEAYFKPSVNWLCSVFSYRETDYYANTSGIEPVNINIIHPRWGTSVKYIF